MASNESPPPSPHTPLQRPHLLQCLIQGTPVGSNKRFSPSSYSSTSTANTTGTVIRHVHLPDREGANVAEPTGNREDELTPKKASRVSHEGIIDTASLTSIPESPKTSSDEPLLGQVVSKPMKPINIGAKGYESGDYVVKLGTAEQEREIDDGPKKAQKSQGGWLKRLLSKKGK